MFVAAMLHAFPQHAAAVVAAAEELAGVTCAMVAHDDGVLRGGRFQVAAGMPAHGHGGAHHHGHDDDGHGHFYWASIRERLVRSALPPAVRGHAMGIFECLAEAEARVHGVSVDQVVFHEVGAADSVADAVAAASVIAAIGPASWSCGALPLGSGRVRTAHGMLPLPAPATALLLEGFSVFDDGIGGERVTPTGAAILRYLQAWGERPAGVMRGSGYGFGTRRLPGMSNCLRVLVMDGVAAQAGTGHRALGMIQFEVDDQSGEDLAAGLDRVRAAPGVHDVVQMMAIGKKGRMAVHVQVLVRPDLLDAAVDLCFRETTTIGLRTQMVQGRALPRRFEEVGVAGETLRVKVVERPGGVVTGKAEADHVLHLEGHAARVQARRQAEMQAVGE
jgi:uncharacterized protein (TIGR00299 family) protein